MKKFLFVLSAVLFLALLAVPSTPANAASVPCSSSPTSGPVGMVVTVTCSGFSPNTYVTSWLTEPDGHAFSWYGEKTGADGDVSLRFYTDVQPFVAFSLGTWTLTVQGVGGAIGKADFTLTGGKEGVSGAMLDVNGSMVRGWGFLPGEIVTVWFDFPNGDCSGVWLGKDIDVGLSTMLYGNYKADNDGDIAFTFSPAMEMPSWFAAPCQGTYHIVARGNASKLGADASWTTPNHDVTETASLVANPGTTSAYGGHIQFSGMGFPTNAIVNCWVTNPQGHVLNAALSVGGIRTDNDGDFAFGYGTGADFGWWQSSEGALGEYAMTCKAGNAVGIARFTLIGNEIDP